MKCPYNRKSQRQVMQYTNDLADDGSGLIRGYQHVVQDNFELMDCLREDCGAYRNGRCCYAAVNLDNQ